PVVASPHSGDMQPRAGTTPGTSPSGALVLVVPRHRLPEFDLVAVRIHDPRELAVLVRFRTLDDVHAVRAQLHEQFIEVVDPIVDHERGLTRAEPLAVLFRERPYREAAVGCLVVRPSEDRAAPALPGHAEMLPVPRRERGAVALALQ